MFLNTLQNENTAPYHYTHHASTETQDGSELEVSSWWKVFRVFEGASQTYGGEKSWPTGQPVNLPDKICLPM